MLLRESSAVVVGPSMEALLGLLGPEALETQFRLELAESGVCLDDCRIRARHPRALELEFRRRLL